MVYISGLIVRKSFCASDASWSPRLCQMTMNETAATLSWPLWPSSASWPSCPSSASWISLPSSPSWPFGASSTWSLSFGLLSWLLFPLGLGSVARIVGRWSLRVRSPNCPEGDYVRRGSASPSRVAYARIFFQALRSSRDSGPWAGSPPPVHHCHWACSWRLIEALAQIKNKISEGGSAKTQFNSHMAQLLPRQRQYESTEHEARDAWKQYPSIDRSIYLCIYLSIDLPIYLPIYLSIYLSIYLYIYLSIYLTRDCSPNNFNVGDHFNSSCVNERDT